jgi:hypothetical protein
MYAGLWQRYSPEGDLLVSYHGARLFDTPKDGVIKQINIYSTQVRGPASTASEFGVRVTALYAWRSQYVVLRPLIQMPLSPAEARVGAARTGWQCAEGVVIQPGGAQQAGWLVAPLHDTGWAHAQPCARHLPG